MRLWARIAKYAVAIMTDNGLRGEYVTHWVGSSAALGQTLMLAPYLIGREAEAREQIYDDLERQARQFDHMGHGPLDIAPWDLHGKKLGASVCELLGGYRKRLPVCASNYHGDRNGGLDSKEAFAAFAQQCYEMGYRAFKIHGWNDGNAREEAANLLHGRKVIGDKMNLMIDPDANCAPSPTRCTWAAPASRPPSSGTRTRFATPARRPSRTRSCAR